MMISACYLSLGDIGWLVDEVAGEHKSVAIVTHYSRHHRRNQRQDTVVDAVRAEAHWRGCTVSCRRLARGRRVSFGRRENLVLYLEPPQGGPGSESMVPLRPRPSAPTRSERRSLPPVD